MGKHEKLEIKSTGRKMKVPIIKVHTLVVGSGAAGLNAAVQLRLNGVEDVAVITEGLEKGTSINTGSDKQTYYKLAIYGKDTDAPALMAESYFAGGSMHGDLALIEAALSVRAFMNLVNLGVPFPRDKYGQFVGYKTDHDPRQRATSIGPYTSREMCRALIRKVKELKVPVYENRNAVELIVVNEKDMKRAGGVIAVNEKGDFEMFESENTVFAVGGPGGLYATSVYPTVHTGAIGIALMAGAKARSLPESQYGLASTKFRWNVSGTYMQVIPRFISTEQDGKTDEKEFLRDYFDSAGKMNSMVFLKGYQWPFDSRKAKGGSSLIDILVYIENVIKKRRVFLDFRKNPEGFSFDGLSEEALQYLKNSEALLDSPIERLRKMNPAAIELYKEHGIDITKEPLEIAVCAQHNNGGLAADHWWQSENITHLFPVGEVNGSHGVYRPGGSALNSGQVGGFRAAEFIANRYARRNLNVKAARQKAKESITRLVEWLEKGKYSSLSWKKDRSEFQLRMSKAGAHIRAFEEVKNALNEAWEQYKRIEASGYKCKSAKDIIESLRNRHLCFAHVVYLDAIRFFIESGVGSRGSALILSRNGEKVYEKLSDDWKMERENESFREKVQETIVLEDSKITHTWRPRRPIPECTGWFETSWATFRSGDIYK